MSILSKSGKKVSFERLDCLIISVGWMNRCIVIHLSDNSCVFATGSSLERMAELSPFREISPQKSSQRQINVGTSTRSPVIVSAALYNRVNERSAMP